ncbi:MAG: methenyltetrahydromethanopterin cyclohydrolase, partial [Planctomycetales bacterium]|nr:methenyltetrahydromethanopterin cyclohydrolase [Planctomycetales bacterium]
LSAAKMGETTVIDCGAQAPGGLEAGLRLAEVCLAGLGKVSLTEGASPIAHAPTVTVQTDHPVAACMASQYAGWEVRGEGYFAMGSGPMRAAAAREELFQTIGLVECPDTVVGVLETDKPPTLEVCEAIAAKCRVAPDSVTLLYAPTNSLAGTVQVVARVVETALHKLHELGFDLSCIQSAWGAAPLPPVAGDTLTGIGRTNDAILYGGHAVLYVRADDQVLTDIGARTPSNASAEHGDTFLELFASHGNDFYQMDKLLFSPAMVTFVNLDSGSSFRYGALAPEVLSKSFGTV